MLERSSFLKKNNFTPYFGFSWNNCLEFWLKMKHNNVLLQVQVCIVNKIDRSVIKLFIYKLNKKQINQYFWEIKLWILNNYIND